MEIDQQISQKLDRLIAVMEQMVMLQGKIAEKLEVGIPTSENDGYAALKAMSPKMHVALQMMLQGSSNKEIADKLQVTESTAKVHVRSVAQKIGVSTRAQILKTLMPLMNTIDPIVYENLSDGLPLDWAVRVANGEEDRWKYIYLA